MAKWGEGDERWKVQDLGQSGRNVNGWHWVENNVLPWSKDRLKELLASQTLVERDGTVVKTADDVTLTGDAIVNQRKGKIIPAYELDLAIKWTGTDAEGNQASGEVKAPYISEENYDEDPEVQVTCSSGGAAGEKMRSLIVQHGRPRVYKAVAQFVTEMQAGGPVMKSGAAADGEGEAEEPAAAAAVDKPSDKPALVATAKPETKKKTSGSSIQITEQYYCSSSDLFQCFTDAGKVRAFTGSAAEVDARPGGAFSMFGGSIQGTFRELQPPNHILMDWRFSSWPEGATSLVKIELEEKNKGAVTLKLHQSGIPDTDRFGQHDVVRMTEAGWKEQVLLRMRRVFGYGA